MTWDWQTAAALTCVSAALFVLGRRVWLFWKNASRGKCGGCSACPVHEGSAIPQSKPLVMLDLHSATNGPATNGLVTNGAVVNERSGIRQPAQHEPR
jgi:hypothetical protein